MVYCIDVASILSSRLSIGYNQMMNLKSGHFLRTSNVLWQPNGRTLSAPLFIATLLIACLGPLGFCKSIEAGTPPRYQAAASLRQPIGDIVEVLLKDFPDDPHLIWLAVSYHRLCDNPVKATSLLEQGLKSNPKSHALCSTMAELSFQTGHYEKAVTYWKKAMPLGPKNTAFYCNLAEAQISAGNNQEAIATLEKSVKAFPPTAKSHFLLGKAYLQLKDYKTARDHFEKAIKLNPNLPEGAYWLAKTYVHLSQREKARDYMQVHQERQARIEGQRQTWVSNRGKPTVIMAAFSDQRFQRSSYLLSELCLRGNSLYKTMRDIPHSREILLKGEQAFLTATSLAPEEPDLNREFARLYLGSGFKLDKACQLAEDAVRLDTSAINYYTYGIALRKTGNVPKAVSALEKAAELDPTNRQYIRAYHEIKGKNNK
jgi:tetratricopeptide (TPR) repeat protein